MLATPIRATSTWARPPTQTLMWIVRPDPSVAPGPVAAPGRSRSRTRSTAIRTALTRPGRRWPRIRTGGRPPMLNPSAMAAASLRVRCILARPRSRVRCPVMPPDHPAVPGQPPSVTAKPDRSPARRMIGTSRTTTIADEDDQDEDTARSPKGSMPAGRSSRLALVTSANAVVMFRVPVDADLAHL